ASRCWWNCHVNCTGRRRSARAPSLVVHCFFELRDAAELVLSILIIFRQYLLGFEFGKLLHRDVSFYSAQDAAAFTRHILRETLDLLGGVVEEFIKFPPEEVVPHGYTGQRVGMIEGFSQ